MIPFYKPSIDVDEIKDSVLSSLSSGQVTNWGVYSTELESLISYYLGRKSILLASGTHALTIGLLGMAEYGLIPKHNAKILVPSFTFFASIMAILWAGMIPVFCDIYPDTFTIDINSATGDYDAVMPVNIFGVQHSLEESFGKPIIGDLSHGFGSYSSNTKTGTRETVACFSSSITKPMQSIEGGILSADDDIIGYAEKFRNWGSPKGKYDCEIIGQWSKITEINSIVGISSFNNLSSSIQRKNKIANLYKLLLGNKVGYQFVDSEYLSTYKDFAVLFENNNTRDFVSTALDSKNIGNKKYFYPPVHCMSCFRDNYKKLHLPVTEDISSRILCLPIFGSLKYSEIVEISNTVLSVINR